MIQPPPPLQPHELFLLSRDTIQDAAIRELSASSGGFVIEPEEPLVQAPLVQVPTQAPTRAPKPIPASTRKARHQWVVQIDSFQNLDNARRRLTAVRRRREEAQDDIESGIEMAILGGRGTFHRVWLGRFESELEAKDLCRLLKTDGTGAGCFVRIQDAAVEPLHVAAAVKG